MGRVPAGFADAPISCIGSRRDLHGACFGCPRKAELPFSGLWCQSEKGPSSTVSEKKTLIPMLTGKVKANAGIAGERIEAASEGIGQLRWRIGVQLTSLAWGPVGPLVVEAVAAAGRKLMVPVCRWIYEDPPDLDFRREVRLKRSHIDPSKGIGREESQEPGFRLALEAFAEIDGCAANLRAMMRAYERSLGAREAGDPRSEEARSYEWDYFCHDSQAGLESVSGSYLALSETINTTESVPMVGRLEIERATPNLVSMRKKSGLPAEPLLKDVAELSPVLQATSEDLKQSGKACRQLASALAEWRSLRP